MNVLKVIGKAVFELMIILFVSVDNSFLLNSISSCKKIVCNTI